MNKLQCCANCKAKEAVVYLDYSKKYLCANCFNDYFEKRVKNTIEKYRMLKAEGKIGVAISGGKDSASLLYALKKLYPQREFVAIHLNQGIGDYSKHAMEKAKELAKMLDVEIYIFEYEKELGVTIPDVELTKYRNKICSVCGSIRRWALWKTSKELGVSILATGHTLDDTVAVMLSNFLSGSLEELRKVEPVLQPRIAGQPVKIKPLIKTPEKDCSHYAKLNNLPVNEVSCPYKRKATSLKMKNLLDEWEKIYPSIKFQLYSVFTKKLIPLLPKVSEQKIMSCKICGGPSNKEICSVCRKLEMIREVKQMKNF